MTAGHGDRPGSGGYGGHGARAGYDVHAGYDFHATARWAPEQPKGAGTPGRGPFVRDRARVLHSSALRRLAAKTQVVEVGSADFPRTRLTHSLECAQIGRELGATVGCDPDLVDAACLAHDLGHPPFGHNGESVLAELAAGCGGFEGNAQSLRLLTRLEAKVPGAGLNLTRATLDATLKYPWPAGGAPGAGPPGADPAGVAAAGDATVGDATVGDATRAAPAAGKYGHYAADAEVFAWVRDGASVAWPCLEAQVMDWADDVAYSVHDLEDGLQAGLVTPGALGDAAERHMVAERAASEYCPPGSVTLAELEQVFAALTGLEFWPRSFDGGPASLAALKRLTSELIGRFCRAAQEATLQAAREPGTGPPGAGPPGTPAAGRPLTRYAADLVVPRRQRLECALLKGVTAHYVMSRPGAAAAQARQRELIAELATATLAGAPQTMEPSFCPAFIGAGSDAERLRVVIDQVASLTDTSAIGWHRRLCG